MVKENRTKEKQMAYLLNKEFGYTKKSIADLMKISPQQMGTWIKDMNYEVKINNLEQELEISREVLKSLDYEPQKKLEYNIIENIIVEHEYNKAST